MKLSCVGFKAFRIAYFGLPIALLAGSASAQGQSAMQAGQAAPVRYSVIDLGEVGNPPAQPYFIRNNGLISGAAAIPGGACMPPSGSREPNLISAPMGWEDRTMPRLVSITSGRLWEKLRRR